MHIACNALQRRPQRMSDSGHWEGVRSRRLRPRPASKHQQSQAFKITLPWYNRAESSATGSLTAAVVASKNKPYSLASPVPPQLAANTTWLAINGCRQDDSRNCSLFPEPSARQPSARTISVGRLRPVLVTQRADSEASYTAQKSEPAITHVDLHTNEELESCLSLVIVGGP